MSQRITGLVVGKDFHPRRGLDPLSWCHLTIELPDESLVSIRISRDQTAKADVGDVVRFRRPRRESGLVRRVVRLASEPALLPPAKRSPDQS